MFGGNLTGLLSGVLPHKVASPRGLALMWTPKIHGTIRDRGLGATAKRSAAIEATTTQFIAYPGYNSLT